MTRLTPIISISINGGDPNVSDESIAYGSTVVLENTDSVNVDAYSWSIVSRPPGSSAALSFKSWSKAASGGTLGAIKTSFVADVYGTYIIELTLNRLIKGRIGAAVLSPHLSIRIPTTNEKNEFDGWPDALYQSIILLEDGYATNAAASGSGSLGGDVSGTLSNTSVIKIQGRSISSTAPTNGQGLLWDSGLLQWKPTAITLSGAASGDLSGTYPSPTVVAIQGRAVDSSAPANSNVLAWSNIRSQWEPTAAGTPAAHASSHESGGSDEIDVTGLSGVLADGQNADQLQTNPVSASAPGSGNVLTWDGSQWAPTAPTAVAHTIGGAQHIADTLASLNTKVSDANLIATTTASAGDVSGTFPTLTVVALQGYAVDGSAPAVGNVLLWNDESASWEPTPPPGPTGSASGDLSGTYPGPTVDGLQGRTLASTAPSDSQVIAWNASLSQWEPQTQSGGGGSGDGYNLFFSDDTEFTEIGTSPQAKKQFRVVMDSEHEPTYWRVIVSLWVTSDSLDTAVCTVDIGGDSVLLWTSNGAETVLKGNIAVSAASPDTLLTATISLHSASGISAAHIKYTDIYAFFG